MTTKEKYQQLVALMHDSELMNEIIRQIENTTPNFTVNSTSFDKDGILWNGYSSEDDSTVGGFIGWSEIFPEDMETFKQIQITKLDIKELQFKIEMYENERSKQLSYINELALVDECFYNPEIIDGYYSAKIHDLEEKLILLKMKLYSFETKNEVFSFLASEKIDNCWKTTEN